MGVKEIKGNQRKVLAGVRPRLAHDRGGGTRRVHVGFLRRDNGRDPARAIHHFAPPASEDPCEEVAAMAKVQRNGPCPCGSGQKAKRCCFGPHEPVGIRVLPLDLCQGVINDLVGIDKTEMRSLFDQLVDLPALESSLHLRLPAILTPDIDRAITALSTGAGVETVKRALEHLLPTLDTLDNRVALAHAVVALRDQGRISAELAAVAVLELDRPVSMLLLSSIAESISVLAGDCCTPAGLLVAAR
jgi:hypothetical protein